MLYLFAALLYCLPTADYILLSFAWHSFPSESFALQPNCILSDTGCQVATCIFFQIEQSFSCPIRPQINIPFLPAVRFPIPFSYENISSSVLLVIFFLPLALNPYFQDILRIAPLKNPMLLLHLHSPETAHSGYPSVDSSSSANTPHGL